MNHIVEVRYQKNEKFPQVLIDGEQISRYMELSEYIYDDIFYWASRLYESMDDELCEPYTVELTGHEFQHEVLKATKSASQYCTAIKFRNLVYKIPLNTKYEYATELNRKYSITRPLMETCVTLACKDPEQFAAYTSARFVTEPCNYYITSDPELPASCGKYCIVVGDGISFAQQHGTAILKVTKQLLPLLLDYFNTYHIQLGFVNAVFASAGSVRMTAADKLEFEAYSTEEYRVMPSQIPNVMECGEEFTVTYDYYPSCFEDPGLVVVSDRPAIISCQERTLHANKEGECTIRLLDSFDKEYCSNTVTVEKHTYINNISVTLTDLQIKVGQSTTFKCVLLPGDAEDINQVQYSVSHPDVVGINPYQSELIGLAPGRACITVSTPRVSGRFFISVVPEVSDVILPVDHLEMPYYADAIIEYTVFPGSTTPKPAATWATSNQSVITIVRQDKNGCRIRAMDFGHATLRCKLKGTDISKTIQIDVVKKV